MAPFQRLSQEGVIKNTPEHIEPETPDRYNGHTRIFGPDGALLAKPDKDFEGLVMVDVSFLSTCHSAIGSCHLRLILTRLISAKLSLIW